MADENQLKILKQGVAAWNEWRRRNIPVDLARLTSAGPGSAAARVSACRFSAFQAYSIALRRLERLPPA